MIRIPPSASNAISIWLKIQINEAFQDRHFLFFYFYGMNIFSVFLLAFLLCFGCAKPKPKTPPPSIQWTDLDEPPLYSDCPQEDALANWTCFTQVLQDKLTDKLVPIASSFPKGTDTLFFTLKVDTLGIVNVVGLQKESDTLLSALVLPEVSKTLASLPPLQPAVKTNLEIPVEVRWSLAVSVTK
jgi:hypothetical protein